MAESEIRAGRKKSWFPRSSRNFSLANIEQDIWDWGYQREADQRDAQEAAALASLPDPEVNHAEGSARYRFDPQRDPGGYIRALVEETNAVKRPDPRDQPPQFGRVLSPLHRRKTTGQEDNDARQRYFMDQLLAAYGRPEQPNVPPASWDALTDPQLQMDLMAYAMDKDGYRANLSDPEEYTGVLGPGSGLGTAMTWSMAFPAMGYGAVGMAQGDEGAGERFTRALNTATAPGQFLAGAAGYAPEPQAGHSAWKDMSDAREQLTPHWTEGLKYEPGEFGPRVTDESNAFAQSMESQMGRMEEGEQFFQRQGLPKTAARYLGAATDALGNPLFNFSGVGSALKSMKALPIATQALYELGPDMAMATAITGGEYLAEQRAERERQHQERMDRLIGRLGK